MDNNKACLSLLQALYGFLNELRGFRNVFRHAYEFELDAGKVALVARNWNCPPGLVFRWFLHVVYNQDLNLAFAFLKAEAEFFPEGLHERRPNGASGSSFRSSVMKRTLTS